MNPTSTTLIIAEIGVNHDGNMEQAIRLIDVAAAAGVDVVKFQTFSADRLVMEDAPKAMYQQENDGEGSQYSMLKRLELSYGNHLQLINHCRQAGVEFLSTGFDQISLKMLVDLGIKRIKIPSGEMTNKPYLQAAASHGLPVILSTGMCTLDEVVASVAVMTEAGLPTEMLTVLHCTSNYPARDEDLNLRAMDTLRQHLGVQIGYSDHSEGIVASIVAASMGAVIIEKHLTLDQSLTGPDHAASIEPLALSQLVDSIRRKDVMLGSSKKQPSFSEIETARVARKSIVTCTEIKAGDEFSSRNLAIKRPGTGMSPMRWDDVLGCTAQRDLPAHYMLDVDDIEGFDEQDD